MSMVSNFGASWCTLEEDNYLTLLEKDLAIFSSGRSVNRVLVFPPLAARFRFLTHKLIKRWPEFESYSVGSEPCRRTIVYFQEYKAEIHERTQKSMNTSKQETGLAPQSSTSGSGKGPRTKKQRQCDSQGNSPTSSRRPAQVFYTPGAFSKQRKHPESQIARSAETSGNIRGTIRKSVTEAKPLKGNGKIIMSLKHISKSDASSQLECKSDATKNRNITENTDTIEHSLDKLHVCSPVTYSAQNTLETENKKKKDSMSAGYAGKETDNDDAVLVHESQLSCIDSTFDHFTNRPPSTDSKEKLIDCYDNNIHSKLEGNYRNQEVSAEDSTIHIENTCDDENIQCNNHKKTNGYGTIEKPIEIDTPTADCNEFATNFVEQDDSEGCPKEKRVSKNTNEKKNDAKEKGRNPKAEIDVGVDRCIERDERKGKIMVNEELILSMDKNVIDSNGKESDNVILSSKRSDVVREDASEASETSSYLKDEDDKIEFGNIEGIVDSINNEKVKVPRKSKRQCKKEMKAKKKEEKIKKRQIKPKSERTTKKCDDEGKAATEEDKVHDLAREGNGNKLPKTEQGNEDMIPDNKVEKNDKCVVDLSPVGFRVDRERSDSKMKNEKESAEEEDWETTWGDDGECLDEDHLAELNELFDTTDLQIVKPQFDYLSFKPNDVILENGVFDHVLEIYDFSPEFKDRDLYCCLSNFREQGVKIHWVDDTHALAVFSNHRTAQQAVELCCSPMLKLRPLYDGTQQSKLKAKRNIDDLQPYKERPKTTKLVANRLVAGALGMKSKMSQEERQLEREKIKVERERKKNKEQQKKDLWESEDL